MSRSGKTARQRAIKRCDDAFSRYIRRRDGNTCVICGSKYNVQCGHLITRERFGTRWYPKNAAAQCERCNSRHEVDERPFIVWFVQRYSEEEYEEMRRKSWQPTKITTAAIELLAKAFDAQEAA